MARTNPRRVSAYLFKGKEYLSVDGALTTAWRFRHGRPSFAHLYPNHEIRRYGKIIGTRKDLTYVGRRDLPVPTAKAALLVTIFGSFTQPRRHQ